MSLAAVDALNGSPGQNGQIEILLLRKQYTKVFMRPEQKHQRAHFHVEYKQEYKASYAVDDLSLLAGYIPRKYETPIIEWARKFKSKLQETWDWLVAGKDVRELVIELAGG